MSICNHPHNHNNNISRDFSKGKSFNFSTWTPVETYNNDSFKQDFVTYEGNLYACMISNTNKVPTPDSRYWTLVLERLPGNNISMGKGTEALNTPGNYNDIYIDLLTGNIYKYTTEWTNIGTTGSDDSILDLTEDLTKNEQELVQKNIGIDLNDYAKKEDINRIEWLDV